MANEGFFDIGDAPAPGTADYDYKVSIRTITPRELQPPLAGGPPVAHKGHPGLALPSPTIVREQVIGLRDTHRQGDHRDQVPPVGPNLIG
jgi:hypothetical protein